MLASKSVITCEDSGGPLEFVIPAKTGHLVVAMDTLWEDAACVLLPRVARAIKDVFD